MVVRARARSLPASRRTGGTGAASAAASHAAAPAGGRELMVGGGAHWAVDEAEVAAVQFVDGGLADEHHIARPIVVGLAFDGLGHGAAED